MEGTQNRNQLIYGILSIACPLVTIAGTLGYQLISRPRVDHGSSDHLTITLMDIGDAMQLFVAIVLGCLAGLTLAILSFITTSTKLSGRIVSYCGLAINGLPLILVIWSLLRDSFR